MTSRTIEVVEDLLEKLQKLLPEKQQLLQLLRSFCWSDRFDRRKTMLQLLIAQAVFTQMTTIQCNACSTV